MKKALHFLVLLLIVTSSQGQTGYDSITISRCTIEENWHLGKWADSLKAGTFKNYLKHEKTVWAKTVNASKALPSVISLANRIRSNGTADISKCFIPRHSINFYKNGKLALYLLVCFECDGLRFSDNHANAFIKSLNTRLKQMKELKQLFEGASY